MCGVAGFLAIPGSSGDADAMRSVVGAMTDTLSHRGPDARGVWCEPAEGAALGHRRLSIRDLSEQGAQPMVSGSGRFVLSFNGEIYNHLAIRTELGTGGSCRWRGNSDTETMLAAFEAWGLNGALRRFTGMFAFALWDRVERRMHLAIDRLGEKPMYYGRSGDVWIFGSELKALKRFPGWSGRIDRGALSLQMRLKYVPAPFSIYEGIGKLVPGHAVTLQPGMGSVVPRSYWSVKDAAINGQANRFRGEDAEAVEELDSRLRRVVLGQMASDVPLGAFLSGGIDSSTIVAIMQAQSERPIKTFTIGFRTPGYDEAAQAAAVARHLGTDHTEHYLDEKGILEAIPGLPGLYDEPFSDASQIPTYLVSKLAREQVAVSLSGDGGDELFGGYNRHAWSGAVWDRIRWLPRSVRKGAASILSAIPTGAWEQAMQTLSPIMPDRLKLRNAGEKVHKLAANLAVANPMEFYRGVISHWDEPEPIVLGADEDSMPAEDPASWPEFPNQAELMMYLDMVGYLPGDILTKVDRAAMGVSLESRVPFLDHELVEFAWALPFSMKIREGKGKWLLRQVLYRYVPRDLVERPKMGFAIPLEDWLRGRLRDWAEALLSGDRLAREGFLNPAPIRAKWRALLEGKGNWQHHIWDVLMFQAWLEKERGS